MVEWQFRRIGEKTEFFRLRFWPEPRPLLIVWDGGRLSALFKLIFRQA